MGGRLVPWPFGNLMGYMADLEPKKGEVKPYPTGMMDILPVFIGGVPKMVLAYFVYTIQYESLLAAAKNVEVDWVLRVVMRNITGTILICGFWDFILYFSPLKKSLERYKFNKVYPDMIQFRRDITFTLCSSFLASVLECLALHSFATDRMGYDREFLGDNAVKNCVLAIFVYFWRIPHFHAMHRAMHPWRTTSIPDVGQFLYTHVHSLHHKSYNPTAFSGTSMHPVEGFLYYTASFLPWLVFSSVHPGIFILCHFDLGIGAWIAHDGFEFPGGGVYFHQLHHQYFECNYGNTIVPLDWLFGTFSDKKPKFFVMTKLREDNRIKDPAQKKNLKKN